MKNYLELEKTRIRVRNLSIIYVLAGFTYYLLGILNLPIWVIPLTFIGLIITLIIERRNYI